MFGLLLSAVRSHGHIVVATARLALSEETLVSGTSDGGKTFALTDEETAKILFTVGNKLHLAQHRVTCLSSDQTIAMILPAGVCVSECVYVVCLCVCVCLCSYFQLMCVCM